MMKVVSAALLLVALMGNVIHGRETLLRSSRNALEWNRMEGFERPDDWGYRWDDAAKGNGGAKGTSRPSSPGI